MAGDERSPRAVAALYGLRAVQAAGGIAHTAVLSGVGVCVCRGGSGQD